MNCILKIGGRGRGLCVAFFLLRVWLGEFFGGLPKTVGDLNCDMAGRGMTLGLMALALRVGFV